MRRHKGFTLIELLIVIVVFGILTTVLFRTYNTIMRLSVRSEFQKNIQTDVLFVNQIMHSLADTHTIDYDAYDDGDVDSSNGMVDKLHLTMRTADEEKTPDTVILSVEGDNCHYGATDRQSLTDIFANSYDCGIWYQKGEEKTRLTSPQTYVTNVGWQLIPYQSNTQTIEKKDDVYQTLAYPGVVMYWRAYHQGYGLRGVTDVSQVVQWFFTLTDKAQL